MTATQERKEDPMTFEQIREMFKEIGRKQEETAQAMKETDRRMKETDRQMKETDRQMKKTDEQIGKLGNRFGDMVECMVLPNLMARFNDLGYAFKQAAESQKIEDDENGIYLEIDAYLENNEYAIAVETKVKPTQNDVDYHIGRMEKLRAYANLNAIKRRYYGGMAGVVMSKEVKAYTLAHGMYAIEPSGETFIITAPAKPEGPKAW